MPGYNFMPATEEYSVLAPYAINQEIEKIVKIMAQIYINENFGIYSVEENARSFTITGNFPYTLSLNAFYKIKGKVVLDKKTNRRQVRVSMCEATFPEDEEGILTVLRSLHGLDTKAYQLYSIIGPDILSIIMTDPKTLVKQVKGVGMKRAQGWQKELLARGENDKELRKLYDLGLTAPQATKLVSEEGLNICETAKNNPYILIGKVRGFTFKKCDEAAIDRGGSVRSSIRIQEGILSTMTQVTNAGHCTYPLKQFMVGVHRMLDVSLNFHQAQSFLKYTKDTDTVTYKFGEKNYRVELSELQDAMRQWNQRRNKKGPPFYYVIDAIEENLIKDAFSVLKSNSQLVLESVDGVTYVTPGFNHKAENEIAANVRDFVLSEICPFATLNQTIREVLNEINVTLEDKQMEAVQRICAAEGGIFILNGSAGCGKTFTLNIIMKVLKRLYEKEERAHFDPCILAPTGKAAKVAAKSTGLPAQTIHRALGLVVTDESVNMEAGMSMGSNCVVVDEFSMVDEGLCALLFDGIKKTSKVILLGDTEQLSSIRSGRCLKDLIESGVVPTITLNVVKRQGKGSGVLVNANKIIKGEMITTIAETPGTKGNAYVISTSAPNTAQAKILKMASQFGLKGFQRDQVRVLCPMKAGETGVNEMNDKLQAMLNPTGEEISLGKSGVFREGDCVIHTKNNYEQPWFEKKNGMYIETGKKGVVNGDTGVIDKISIFKDYNGTTHRVMYVQYDDHYIMYDNEFEEISLAYAMTIHKSQGSQWPVILCPIVQGSILMNRKLIYTMYTRAQESNVLIGNEDVIHKAILNNKEDSRMTLLVQRIQKKI